jgi:single-strand DNA-binding protein
MNSVVLIGRLTKDPEIRYISESQKAVATFSIAVDRPFAKEKTADFLNIVVFGNTAENCGKFLVKGRLVGVQGRIQTDSYTAQTGEKKYKTEVIADRVEFLEWGDKQAKSGVSSEPAKGNAQIPDGFQALDDDDEIPF